MLSPIGKALRIASIVLCLLIVTSFVVFAIDQTGSASNQQQQVLAGETPAPATAGQTTGSRKGVATHESGLHKAIDDASREVTSPFAGITSGSNSEWVVRGVNVLLALIVYGFGVGYLARFVRVRS